MPLGPQPAERLTRSAMRWIFGWRPDAPPPPGGRRWLLRSRAAGSESPVPCSSPNMVDGSSLRPPGERGRLLRSLSDGSHPPRPRSTAASLPSHLFIFVPAPPLRAATGGLRYFLLPDLLSTAIPPQQRGLSDSVSLFPPGFRHQCNEVDRYRKKEAGTGELLTHFNNKINKHKGKAAAPHGRLPHTMPQCTAKRVYNRCTLNSMRIPIMHCESHTPNEFPRLARRWRPQTNHPFIYFRSARPRRNTAQVQIHCKWTFSVYT